MSPGIARSGPLLPGFRIFHSTSFELSPGGGYAATVGNPTPITFSRRDSAVKANSFISWLE